MKYKLLTLIAILAFITPTFTFADSVTIDPNNVGPIVMQNTATMTFGTTGTVLSSSGLSINGATSTANMYVAVADKVLASTADVSVFNTASGGYIGTTTIAANSLYIGKSFSVKGWGLYSTPALNTATALLKISMASTTFTSVITSATTAALVASAAGWNYNWNYDCTVRSIGTVGTIICDGIFNFALSSSGTTYASVDLMAVGNIDTTHALSVQATNAWSSVAGGQTATEQQTILNWNN